MEYEKQLLGIRLNGGVWAQRSAWSRTEKEIGLDRISGRPAGRLSKGGDHRVCATIILTQPTDDTDINAEL